MSRRKLQLVSKFNPVWKGVAKRLAGECRRCGHPRLYSIFDAYITGDRPDCRGCSAVHRLASPLIERIFSRTNLEEDDLKNLMADKMIRKSMLNVVRGIGHFGIKTPQPRARTGLPKTS